MPSKGRKPKLLEPGTWEAIVTTLRNGAYYETAAAAAGVDRVTLYRWLERGARPGAPEYYRRFREDVMAARAQGEARALDLLWQYQAGGAVASERREPNGAVTVTYTPPDPKVLMWLLERGYPARWGRRIGLEVAAADAVDALPSAESEHDILTGLAARIYARAREVRGELPVSPHEGDVVDAEIVDPG